MIDTVLDPFNVGMISGLVMLIVIFAGWGLFMGAEKAWSRLKRRRSAPVPVGADVAKPSFVMPQLTLLGLSRAIIGTYGEKKIPASILVKCEMRPGQTFQIDLPFEGVSTASSVATPPSQPDRVRLLVTLDGLLYSQEIPWTPLA